ncbi:MAG: hypothetical protein CMO55_19725 [Verrucomicrobiales bacterium]|nr:hypothetical protein [Verrucomicrobiales bacterium]
MGVAEKRMFRKGIDIASKQVDGSMLGLFRILWGLIMLLETRWLWIHTADFHNPSLFHFHFTGFSWIRHFPSVAMTELEISVMMLAVFFMTVGFAFRPAAIIYFLGYTHLFFSEAASYNNHFYLIVLISGILIFTRADNSLSLYQWLRGKGNLPEKSVPFWNYLLIRFQVIVVYFYGAIAKINHDWLIEMEPIRFWLGNGKHIPEWLAPVVSQEWFVALAAWGGLFIDLICPILLLFRKTRIIGIAVLLSFHLLNSQLFRIGYFPLIGIVLMLVFLPPGALRRFLKKPIEFHKTKAPGRIAMWIAGAYIAFQILFPLRSYLVPRNNPSWSDRYHFFSWRMMLREKIAVADIHFGDPEMQQWLEDRPSLFPRLSEIGNQKMGENPYFLRQWILALQSRLDNFGKGDTPIYLFVGCSLNGRPYYPLIDPNKNICETEVSLFTESDWILPLPELPVDYEQIKPFNNQIRFSNEAIRKYLADNPGPGTQFLNEIPNEDPFPQSE